MAMYHQTADRLKDQVLKQNFNAEQLNIILKLMRGCTMLRQGKVINSFFELVLPQNFQLSEGEEKTGKYGTYKETIVTGKI